MSEVVPPAEQDPDPGASPGKKRRKQRRTDGRRCDNCGATLHGRFCAACGQRDRNYELILCENCGAEKQGLYCAVCGQNDRDYRRTVFPVVGEILAETFETDSRLFRTAKVLFTKPGFLSTEFSRNRRAGYIAPFRLYLFTSIVFFFVLSLRVDLPEGSLSRPSATGAEDGRPFQGKLRNRARPEVPISPGREATPTRDAAPPVAAEDAPHEAPEVSAQADRPGVTIHIDLGAGKTPEGEDTEIPLVAGGSESLVRGPDGRFLLTPEQLERVDRFRALLDDQRGRKFTEILRRPYVGEAVVVTLLGFSEEDYGSFGDTSRYVIGQLVDVLHRPSDAARVWFEYLPVAMFSLLPLYALLLKVFYLRRGRFYSEHLVFGMHIHTVAYLVFSVMVLVPDQGIGSWVNLALLLGLAGYYFVALKRYYEQGAFLTLVKYAMLAMVYSWLLVLALLGAAAAVLVFY